MERVERENLRVDAGFADFVETEMLPGTGLSADEFWAEMAALVDVFGPELREVLAERDDLQCEIDAWHQDRRSKEHSKSEYRSFLEKIRYIEPEVEDFRIDVSGIDPEISSIAGPQLVVPATNPRFAINAANARWNSLFDGLYGTDAIGPPGAAGPYDTRKGAEVIAWSKSLLDEIFPLRDAVHSQASAYRIVNGELAVSTASGVVGLADREQFRGYRGDAGNCASVLLANNGLHVELKFDSEHPVGKDDPSGLCDIIMESAVTTIVDCEDSVAVVDGEDKVTAYRTWLGLMRGDIETQVEKAGRSFTRRLDGNRTYCDSNGEEFELKGQSLLLVRNVGHLMPHPTIHDNEGMEIGEGLIDALSTVVIALHDIRGSRANSKAGSIYVVKPKMHGSEEVRITCRIFEHIEDAVGLPRNTVKIGIMDEERRTSINLRQCIYAARNRLAFINTGFLDRTGDEIHTSMEFGPMPRKAAFKKERWLQAYEDRNVQIGLACGLGGVAQIGKGMWAMPDLMSAMIAEKGGHPAAGANTAWVPSPTAATLHAIHYHRIDVFARQAEISAAGQGATLDDLLQIPNAIGVNWSDDDIRDEVENNLQGILGYVVRWVDQGIGCSKVPDINDVALMEDRATCRISSQHLSNWLRHGIVDQEFVENAMRRMAKVVDKQNAADPNYRPMAPDFDGPAFAAAHDLVFHGCNLPSGYTEPVLHEMRLEAKASGG